MELKSTKLSLFISLTISWSFAGIFVIPLCGALFKCGCTWLWAGGSSSCVGMMDAAGMHHHCPWCSDSPIGPIIPLAWIAVAQAALIFIAWRKYRANAPLQIAVGIIAFLTAGYTESLIHGWFKHYPH